MLIIPAIDLKNNNCVRLIKGDFNNIFLFSNNPLKIFLNWIKFKPKRIHIVDLDGAFYGKPKNLFIIKSILKFNNKFLKLQIGGGIRSFNIIKFYFNIGFYYIILGTKIIIDLNFLKFLCLKFPNKIILGLDFKHNKILLNAWKNIYNINFIRFFKKISILNFESIICTDVNKDGTLKGLNINLILNLYFLIKKPIISSGGLYSLKDIKSIFNIQKFFILGLICGKSIYSGNLLYYNLIKKLKNLNKIYI